jgi:hypothetical protein
MRIEELPTNSTAPWGGALFRSAAANAARDSSQRSAARSAAVPDTRSSGGLACAPDAAAAAARKTLARINLLICITYFPSI